MERDENDPVTFIAITELNSSIEQDEFEFNYAKFQDEFEKVQKQYHEYVACFFDYAEKEILGNVGASKGTVQASTPNMINWMDPPAACLTSDKLKEIKNKTVSDAMLPPLLEIYNEYSDYLDALVVLYEYEGRETKIPDEELSLSGIDQLTEMVKAYTGLDRIVKLEKENALVAMDIAFKSLKELRLAFFMHVHFQCMLNNLEKYRKWLADIRTIVEGFPLMLEDASMVK